MTGADSESTIPRLGLAKTLNGKVSPVTRPRTDAHLLRDIRPSNARQYTTRMGAPETLERRKRPRKKKTLQSHFSLLFVRSYLLAAGALRKESGMR